METTNMTINKILEKSIILLKNNNIEEPILKSKIILANYLNKNKEYLFINGEERVSSEIEKIFFEKINELCDNVPLQYITNHQEFMNLDFYVDSNVLIPRNDTEVLVERVIKKVGELQKLRAIENTQKTCNIKILDMCTGSGAIAISLAKLCRNVEITAVDKSAGALSVAIKNYEHIRPDNKIKFIESNMFENLEKYNKKYNIIVSNPPYIETEVIKTLDKDVQNEPQMALDGGVDGLDFYRIIFKNLEKFLEEGGDVFLEIGYNQARKVTEIFKSRFEKVECIKDYSGNDRVIVGRNFTTN